MPKELETIKLREAIKEMRTYSRINVPFSFSYISYSEDLRKSDGLKVVERALLRKGYRDDQSKKAGLLIAYTDYNDTSDKQRQFYLPLMMTFNNKRIIP
jgi:hypothetical protein